MLTVKHRHNDGTETIYEALSVTRENGGHVTIPPSGDIVIHTDQDFPGFAGPGSCFEGNGRIRISARWLDQSGFDHSRIFVMNRFGATVEQHRICFPQEAVSQMLNIDANNPNAETCFSKGTRDGASSAIQPNS